MPQLRSFTLCFLLFITFFYTCVVDAVPRYALDRRDGTTSTISTSITSTSTSASQTSSATNSESTAMSTTSAVSSTTSESAASTSSISSFSSQILASTSVAASQVATTTAAGTFETGLFNSTLTPNLLPITPTITPAFSVAGVILILSGCVYAFIGIKIKRLHIFLSASYLTSLSITVLIVYIMNPPVSNAIEGAYLIAIVLPGFIVGGAAIVFPDMTEGIGCIFGGFCFSMWLLVLKAGGLLTSTAGISILIAAFCVVTLATSFSHHTRPYGLMFSLSFGGATAIVIGIDCFSRAGLKEFWAWIWNLNTNLFPLGATTYPITRGIRVEIAAIFVIFLAAMASQLKLWNILSKKKAERKLKKRQDEENHEREEEDVGRQIVERSGEDRDQWEAVYGDGEKLHPAKRPDPPRSIADSGVGSDLDSPKNNSRSAVTSIHRQSTDESIEMNNMGMTAGPKFSDSAMSFNGQDGGVTVMAAHDDRDDINTIPELENDDQFAIVDAAKNSAYATEIIAEGSINPSSRKWTIGADDDARLAVESELRDKHKTTSVPQVVPLPFQPNFPMSRSDDTSSVGTYNDDSQSQYRPKRLSTGNPLKRLSRTAMRNSQRLSGLSMDDCARWSKMSNLGHLDTSDCDRRSSIAATVDDISDKDDLESLPADMTAVSPLEGQFRLSSVESSFTEDEKKPARPVSMSLIELQRTSFGLEKTSIKDEGKTRARSASLTETIATTIHSSVEEMPKQKSPPAPSPPSLTEEVLPPSPSKVVMSYRTNEWAKHLSHAEAPPVEEIKTSRPQRRIPETESQEDHEEQQEDIDDEMPAHLDWRALQQTASSGTPAPAPRLRSRENSRSSLRDRRLQPRASASKGPPQAHANQSSRQRSSTTRQSMQRSGSALSMNADNNIRHRSTSSPSPVPLYAHSNSTPNLLSQRQSLVKQKKSFMSLNPLASTPEITSGRNSTEPSTPGLSTDDTGSVYSRRYSQDRDHETYDRERGLSDNMSLRERQALMQKERERDVLARGTPSPFRLEYYNQQQKTRNSPSRSRARQSSAPGAQRDAIMASWRASVQDDLQGMPSRNTPTPNMGGYGNGHGMGGQTAVQPTGRISVLQEREIDLRREQLFEEKRREGMMNTLRKEDEIRKEVERGAKMRMSALDGNSGVESAHREAMRRLQRKASKNM